MTPIRVLLSGPFARARVGGIKTHVERLRALLPELGMTVDTIDPRAREVLSFPLRAARADIIHLHGTNGWLVFALCALARSLGKRTLITVHGNIADFRARDRAGFVAAARLGAELLVLNDGSARFAAERGLRHHRSSAFLPPTQRERETKQGQTTRLIEMLGDASIAPKPVFITYTFDGSLENDIYGIQDLIGFFAMRKQWILTILACSNAASLRSRELPDNIVIFDGDVMVTELAGRVSGIIRNTSTDGDSMFVREGLYSGIPVVATDVVSRPDGVWCYRRADYNDLDRALHATFAVLPERALAWDSSSIREVYGMTTGPD